VEGWKNLATFSTTSLDDFGRRVMADCAATNLVGGSPVAEYEKRCVSILADLWHAPDPQGIGCSATGSSEACMLGGLALLRAWQRRNPGHGRPNLVMGANAHVCWDKFCAYWGVEARKLPLAEDAHHVDAGRIAASSDTGTIGVVSILGSTYDGSYEPVAEVAAALDALAEASGIDVPIHVDAASGGMVAPFLDPDLVWDFRIPRVVSINTSGHKYGLALPTIGWILWRDASVLAPEMRFSVRYLGGELETLGMSFSRPASLVALQYYLFLRLGREGYRNVHQRSRDVARYLSDRLRELDAFDTITDGSYLPVVAVAMKAGSDTTVYDIERQLRLRGWRVPAYPLPPVREDLHVLRFVIRDGFDRVATDTLVQDLGDVLSGRRTGAAAVAAHAA
jgi:glutamate decarboxylase